MALTGFKSNKRKFNDNEFSDNRSDCDVTVFYDTGDDTEVSNKSPILWCPQCGKKHRFMFDGEVER